MIKAIHALLVALPPFAAEPVPESAEERAERLKPVAGAIWQATTTRPSGFSRGQWSAVLVSLGWHETRFARYVQVGECETGPVGARCDAGRARGLWQQHRSACPSVWELEPGSVDELREGARCASRLMYAATRRCSRRAPTLLVGGFSGYAGASCNWHKAHQRERTAWLFAGKLGA